jgi:hypothetical protein
MGGACVRALVCVCKCHVHSLTPSRQRRCVCVFRAVVFRAVVFCAVVV